MKSQKSLMKLLLRQKAWPVLRHAVMEDTMTIKINGHDHGHDHGHSRGHGVSYLKGLVKAELHHHSKEIQDCTYIKSIT